MELLWNYGLLEYKLTPMSGNLSITFRGSNWKQAKNLTSSDSMQVQGSWWKHLKFIKNWLGDSPALLIISQWNLDQDSMFSWRMQLEMSGSLLWSTIQQRNLNHIGLSFLLIPYWEGQDPWSNLDLNLLISNWKLKANTGKVLELIHQILINPSTQCSQHQSYQLCQWTVWFHHHRQLRLHCHSR